MNVAVNNVTSPNVGKIKAFCSIPFYTVLFCEKRLFIVRGLVSFLLVRYKNKMQRKQNGSIQVIRNPAHKIKRQKVHSLSGLPCMTPKTICVL